MRRKKNNLQKMQSQSCEVFKYLILKVACACPRGRCQVIIQQHYKHEILPTSDKKEIRNSSGDMKKRRKQTGVRCGRSAMRGKVQPQHMPASFPPMVHHVQQALSLFVTWEATILTISQVENTCHLELVPGNFVYLLGIWERRALIIILSEMSFISLEGRGSNKRIHHFPMSEHLFRS